ncbi:sorbitol-6-phosphate dehydrogenase subunit [Acerihabitans sp.]|uniref:sorbitol-6-phosphate dehydrogenase subunit n=1 Tax=Acerihabitans sp. TaxID=2811394 RepID=UPI002ED77B64
MENTWLDLQRKVVIVTGGNSGIGKKIVENLHGNRARVVVADISQPAAAERLADVDYITCDITRRGDVEHMVRNVAAKFTRIDGLINNAGVNRARLLVDYYQKEPGYELTDEDFDFMVGVNQKGLFVCSQEVARLMIKQRSGVIVNILSEAGLEGSKGQSCYAATKGAVQGFTLSWAKELGGFGIRVVGVAPGINERTPMGNDLHRKALAYTRGIDMAEIDGDYSQKLPLGRSGRLEEIADLVCYLVSDHSSYITGTTINITGGKSKG